MRTNPPRERKRTIHDTHAIHLRQGTQPAGPFLPARGRAAERRLNRSGADTRDTWHRRAIFAALRRVFRLTPMPVAMRDRLRQRFLERHSGLVPAGPRGRVEGTPAAGRSRACRRASEAAVGYVAYRQQPLPDRLPARVVAFYLPQFHPIPENDAWWGKGFTEWSNVARALPQFRGHPQPRLPGELGFYDLRLADAMRAQMRLAREYGVSAFCSYYYWFAGKRLLDTPLEQWLSDRSMDLPLCLCWANENWSRRWDGRGDEILIEQAHSAEDDIAFINHVSRFLADPRYLRVDDKPLLLVYRPFLLPDARATADRWRTWCREHGIGEIMLAYVQGFERPKPGDIGFDAAVEFPPNLSSPTNLTARQSLLNPDFSGEVVDWRDIARQSMQRKRADYLLFPGVNPGWDNEPRRSGRGRVLAHASPRAYRDWLANIIDGRLQALPASQRLVFVNAWNEWAEGAVLEPDARLGYAWLQATRDALMGDRTPAAESMPAPATARPCVVIHAWYPEVLADILAQLRAARPDWRIVITTAPERAEQVRHCAAPAGPRESIEIEVFENRGRDILPFLHVANRLLDEGEDTILKLHTKRSTHRHDGDQWRAELMASLLGPGRIEAIRADFDRRPQLGLVAPDGHVQPLSYYWGANRSNVHYLCTRLGIAAPDPERDHFAAGSMFWVRLASLRPLLDAHLNVWEFHDESGQVDGTMAHAIERVFALAAAGAGFQVTSAAALVGASEPAEFTYARKDLPSG